MDHQPPSLHCARPTNLAYPMGQPGVKRKKAAEARLHLLEQLTLLHREAVEPAPVVEDGRLHDEGLAAVEHVDDLVRRERDHVGPRAVRRVRMEPLLAPVDVARYPGRRGGVHPELLLPECRDRVAQVGVELRVALVVEEGGCRRAQRRVLALAGVPPLPVEIAGRGRAVGVLIAAARAVAEVEERARARHRRRFVGGPREVVVDDNVAGHRIGQWDGPRRPRIGRRAPPGRCQQRRRIPPASRHRLNLDQLGDRGYLDIARVPVLGNRGDGLAHLHVPTGSWSWPGLTAPLELEGSKRCAVAE
mmetsp:Transcript_29070/g.77940  ORF Transcript_29070/g.77940 Transcript_29070/m.77940 type:complete len:304 (+) Transcript_29070:657-1568(+)